MDENFHLGTIVAGWRNQDFLLVWFRFLIMLKFKYFFVFVVFFDKQVENPCSHLMAHLDLADKERLLSDWVQSQVQDVPHHLGYGGSVVLNLSR